MHSVKESVIQTFIRNNYPNAKLVSWDDPDNKLEFYTADQLQEIDKDWFPLYSQKNAETQKVVYGGLSNIVHTYTEGETGAGKTSRFAMQSIRALSCLKGKPSFVIVDIHGELAENLYPHLRENGYEVKILNCDDPNRSDSYNPFTPLIRRCLQSGSLDNETIKGIRKIAEIMQPISSKTEPIWEQGARSYTNGCILDKFEDLLQGNIPPQCITLYNIIENHYWLRNEITGPIGNLNFIPHYKEKGTNTLSAQKIMSVTNNAEKTRASYFGVIENHYDTFGQPSLYQLSSNNSIDIDRFFDHPTAIFIQSGSTTIGDDLIGLLVNEIYTTAVIRGKSTAKKMLPRKIHCFLDEFANSNIAEGPEFIKMLTTSRKFGMYWHMLLQCDAQLDHKFDTETAHIIRANCTEIFMGSNEYETMVRFAKSCGQKTVESLGSLVSQEVPVLETVDLITADKLNLTEHGHVYIKTNRRPLLHSYMEAFYQCPEFVPVADIRSIYPTNTFDYKKTFFTPDDILYDLSDLECHILTYLHQNGSVALSAIKKEFGTSAVTAVRSLEEEKLLKTDHMQVSSLITDQQYALIHFRLERNLISDKVSNTENDSAAAYFEKHSTEYESDTPISQLTCLHEDLEKALYRNSLSLPLDTEQQELLQSPVLHFQLIEAFIQNNHFLSKQEWVDHFQKEIDIAYKIPKLPAKVKSSLTKAMEDFSALSLDSIKEVKRMIS